MAAATEAARDSVIRAAPLPGESHANPLPLRRGLVARPELEAGVSAIINALPRLHSAAASQTDAGGETLAFYTRTCRSMWQHVPPGCTSGRSTGIAPVYGVPLWSREQLCPAASQRQATVWDRSARQVWQIWDLSKKTFSFYAEIHKAASGSVVMAAQGGQKYFLDALCGVGQAKQFTDSESNSLTAMKAQAATLWWTMVRDPIERFISGFNTIHMHPANRQLCNATNRDSYLLAYIDGMLRQGAGSSHYVFDQHIASQATELACMQRPQNSSIPRLTFISKLENVTANNGTVNEVHLPSLTLPHVHKAFGKETPCFLRSGDLTSRLLRKLCAYYAQDIVCFQYQIPAACQT